MRWIVVAYFLTWGLIPWILLAQKRPVSTLAWIWAVVLFPFAGPVGYLLFGVDRITRPRRRQRARAKPAEPAEQAPPVEPRDAPLFRALAVLSGCPTSTAAEPRLLPNATAFYPALQQTIERAKQHAHVQFFVWEPDEYGQALRDVLVAAARRGVAVRVLMDRVGSLHTRQDFFARSSRRADSFRGFGRSIRYGGISPCTCGIIANSRSSMARSPLWAG